MTLQPRARVVMMTTTPVAGHTTLCKTKTSRKQSPESLRLGPALCGNPPNAPAGPP